MPDTNVSPSASPASDRAVGRVVFVGAGPGQPDLLTLRAVAKLKVADTIVHDQLVPTAILEQANPAAERIPITQLLVTEENDRDDPGRAIGRQLAKLAATGGSIVRLKGGDPAIFARLREELEPLTRCGIPFEIVPGVTAATAAAAAAGIPLTSRDSASSLTIVTGHEATAKRSALDYQGLVGTAGTIVFYMGVEQSSHWSQALLDAGLRGDTTVSIISRCSWPDQQIRLSTLETCAADIRNWKLPAPAIAIVGAQPAGQPSCPPAQGPLQGCRLLVTRPVGQTDELIAAISKRGGDSVHLPLVTIDPPPDPQAFAAAVESAWSYDWIVFASANGVRQFAKQLRSNGRDARALGTARLAAIGPATRDALEDNGFACDLMPAQHQSEGLAASLATASKQGRFLLIRADKGRDLLRQELESHGHEVDQVAAYTSQPLLTLEPESEQFLAAFPVNWILITSSSIAETAVHLFAERLRDWNIASISPVTSATLIRLGHPPTVEAAVASTEAMLDAIAAWQRPPQPQASL
jgi:uroporphyrinogen III methyltransferase/synthase